MSQSESLLPGIKLLREMLAATPVGYVNAILSTAINIVEAVQSSKEVDNDLQRLAVKVVELSIACTESLTRCNGSEFHDIQLYAGTFIKYMLVITGVDLLDNQSPRSPQNVANAILKVPRRGFLGRMAGRLSKAKAIRDLEAQLEDSSTLLLLQLQVKNGQMTKALAADHNAQRIEVQDAIDIGQKKQLDLIRSRMLRAAEKRRRKSNTFLHYPPPLPQLFFGRDDQVQQLVTCFQTVPSYQAILGPGGIGKTSLSLRVFHDPRTISIFGRHRYFLSCESIQDVDGLAAALASIFDLQEKSIISQLKALCSIIGTGILFLLDNFETLWERSENCEKVEAMLADLTTIPNLSLLVSLRGGERPSGVAWSRPFFPVLKPISLEASRRLFLSIAEVEESDPSLEKLLTAVEGLPLAVTLLASQAQSCDCGLLLSAWEAQKTSMVTRGFAGRLSSLDTSIGLSIASSRMINVESALPALQMLSFLPDGATTADLALMAPHQDQIAIGAITLCQVSLASFTPDQRLRVLSPIREYVRGNYPPNMDLFEHMFQFHGDACRYAAEVERTPDWKLMVETLAPRIGNIHTIIYEALLHDTLVARGIKAAIDIVSFHSCAFLGSIRSLLNTCLAIAGRLEFRQLEADCYFNLATTCFDPVMSHESFTIAISIYRELGVKDSLAKALLKSASNANALYQPRLAESFLTQAAGIWLIDLPIPHRIEFLVQNGRMLTQAGDYSSAQKNFDAAFLLLANVRDPWATMQVCACISNFYLFRDQYSAAIEVAKSGLSATGLHDHWTNISTLCHMGLAYFAQGQVSNAESAVGMAFDIALQFAREEHMAWCKYYLAYFALANQRLDDAESQLQASWMISKSTGDVILRLHHVCMLGHLELFRHHTTAAVAHFEEVKRMLHKLGNTPAGFVFYLLPKARSLCQAGMARCSTVYSICSVLRCRDVKQGADTAVSLLVLGDGYILDEEPDTITARGCYEAAFRLLRSLGARRLLAHALVWLAVVNRLESRSSSDLEKVVRHFKESAKIFQEIGHLPGEKYCLDQAQSIGQIGEMVSLLGCPLQTPTAV